MRGGNLSADVGTRLNEDGLVFIDEELATRFERSSVRKGDLIFTCWGTINQVGLVDGRASFSKYIVSNKQMKLTVDPSIADPLFVYYYFSSPLGQSQIEERGIGSSVPGFNLTQLRSIEIPLPGLEEQGAIVRVLGSLDDKIELNRRMNATLEAMAQAIFRDWFVDFGPVRRKMEGATDPIAIMGGLTTDAARAAEVANLFSDALECGDRPVGWDATRIEELLELTYGKALPKEIRRPGGVPVYGSGGIGGWHDQHLEKGPTIIVGRKGTVGSLYWEPGPFFAIDTVFYVRPRRRIPLTFLWQLLKSLGLEGMNTDAAVPGLNRSNVYRLAVLSPPRPVLDAFETVVGSLRARLDHNHHENEVLSETRDYLLPRLMAGVVKTVSAA